MKKLFSAIGAAVLMSTGGMVAAQSTVTEAKQVKEAVEKPVETATQPDPGTRMRLSMLDTSPGAFRKLDDDQDGRISALEAANNPRVAAAFTMADRDKDGYLSKEEFEAMNPSSPNGMRETDASSPSGDRATTPSGDHASYPSGDRSSYPSGDHASYPSGDRVSEPTGDQAATGPNEPTPTDNSPSPRRVAHPRR